jgi:Abortive infection alpha
VSDPSVELMKAAAEGGVQGFVQTVFGPLIEGGEWIGDIVRRQRMKTQIKTLRRADEMLREAGLPARVVPAKTLVPLLELAGLEEDVDDEMQERWAALLANAAAAEDTPEVLPSFAPMLSEITAPEAKMLEGLAGLRRPQWSHMPTLDLTEFMAFAGYDWRSDQGRETSTRDRYEVFVNNLERLRLIEVDRESRISDLQRELTGSPMMHRTKVQLTALGAAFVDACTTPSARGLSEPTE